MSHTEINEPQKNISQQWKAYWPRKQDHYFAVGKLELNNTPTGTGGPTAANATREAVSSRVTTTNWCHIDLQ